MEHLIIAIILILGPSHELLGGRVLPGASTDMETCYKKAAAYLQHIDALPEGTVAVPACAALAKGTGT